MGDYNNCNNDHQVFILLSFKNTWKYYYIPLFFLERPGWLYLPVISVAYKNSHFIMPYFYLYFMHQSCINSIFKSMAMLDIGLVIPVTTIVFLPLSTRDALFLRRS